MAVSLAALLQQLRRDDGVYDEELEPDVDERDVADDKELREQADLERGVVMKGTVEKGEGTARPKDGDVVFLHLTFLSPSGAALWSSRTEHGGAGHPQPFIVGKGKGCRLPRGMELGVIDMTLGERAVLEVQPSYGFKHRECGMQPPAGVKAEDPLTVDVQLANLCTSGKAKAVGPEMEVLKRVLKSGEGWETPRPPFEVVAHVSLRLLHSAGRAEEGQLYFSTSGGQGGEGRKPVTAVMGSGQLPRGVELGLQSMTRGEQALAYFPLKLAAAGSLMPGSPLGEEDGDGAWVEARLELLDFMQVRDMTGDGGVVKKILVKGAGEFPMDCPLEDSTVQVHYRVLQLDTGKCVLDTRQGPGGEGRDAAPVEFDSGMGMVPEALDMSVRLMLVGELSSVRSSWRYSYQGRSDAPQGLPPGSDVEFLVELVGFTPEPNWAELEAEQKLGRASKWKEQGNTLYKQGRYKHARTKYQKALRVIERTMELEGEEQLARADAIKLACFLNLSQVAMKEESFGEALSFCNKAIDVDLEHAKAYFRRAAARAALGEYDLAREDLSIAAQLQPSLAEEVERELRRLVAREAAAVQKQKAEFRKFFDRGSG